MTQEFDNSLYGKVRTAIIDEEPCFNLKDLCRIYDIKNMNEVRSKLNDSGVKSLSLSNEKGTQKTVFITADNLANLFFQSTKDEAEMISDWLYRIVLPQLIKYGTWRVEDLRDPAKAIEVLEAFQDTKVRATILETTMKLNSPKIKMIDQLLGSSSCIDLDMLHEVIKFKDVQKSDLFKILRAVHVLNDNNLPLQEYCDKKYFRVVEAKVIAGGSIRKSIRTYVYQSGIALIERLLKEYEGNKHGKK